MMSDKVLRSSKEEKVRRLHRRLNAGMDSGVILTVSTVHPSLAWTQTLGASLVTRSGAKPGRRLTAEAWAQCFWQAHHLPTGSCRAQGGCPY